LATRTRAHGPRARRADTRQDRIRYSFPGGLAGREVSAALFVQIRPRLELRTSRRLAALVRLLSSQPAEYANGEIDPGHDAFGAGRHPQILGSTQFVRVARSCYETPRRFGQIAPRESGEQLASRAAMPVRINPDRKSVV